MLNHLWMSLIAIGILTAAALDVKNEITNPYRNSDLLPAVFQPAPPGTTAEQRGTLSIPADVFGAFYGLPASHEIIRQEAILQDGTVTLQIGNASSAIWREMASASGERGTLHATVTSAVWSTSGSIAFLSLAIEPIRFVRMKAITQAAFDYAGLAVTIALGLVGVMALWLGVMKVAEEAGLLRALAVLLRPIMRRLFPDIPSDHPAIAAIIMNTAANMLGLSNAATPLGLKAMEELNKLNARVGTATNAMITFLAINTGGLILIPATAIAVRAAAGSSNPGIIIGTSIVGAGCATVAGVVASKILERLPRYRKMTEADND